MPHISIDLETFSSVLIAKAGAYKYVQSPDFEILLIAYSVDSNEPEIIDLAQGEVIPQWLYDAIRSPDYIKHAYNATFEWYCLSKFYGRLLPVEQWRDTIFHAHLRLRTDSVGVTSRNMTRRNGSCSRPTAKAM